MSTPRDRRRGHARARRRRRVAVTAPPGPRRAAARRLSGGSRGRWCCRPPPRYEHPDRVGRVAARALRPARRRRSATLPVLHRREAEDAGDRRDGARRRAFVYLADGSPLHLRSVLKGSASSRRCSPRSAAARSSRRRAPAATVLCDPMVDPRGGAYTVGLGVVEGLAVFPYHGTAADHLLRALDRPASRPSAVLVGIDEETALAARARARRGRSPAPARVTIYGADGPTHLRRAAPTGIDLP